MGRPAPGHRLESCSWLTAAVEGVERQCHLWLVNSPKADFPLTQLLR